ncbi:DUF397 domain-containing protein [Streptomyces sp. NPDC002701]|uniref:DUF397 domain-containing protein n=1 Tax=Streptomyces sp. NPDC002701 TaxID=3364661 RepID=UPI0036CC5DC6
MAPNWRTSSYTETQNCVEVADNDLTVVMVRDTKARGRGMIEIHRATWVAFVEHTVSSSRPRRATRTRHG